jgi:hypothetical protein
MKALFLPPTASEVSSVDDDDSEDDEDSSVGSISISASGLEKRPSISLSYKRDPGDIMRLLTEDRQDEAGEEKLEASQNSNIKNGEVRRQGEPFWKIPTTWSGWFPPPLDMNKRVSYLAPSSSEDEEHSEEELVEQRDAYDDVAWAEKRAKEAIAFHRNNRRRQQQQEQEPQDGETAPRSLKGGTTSSTMMPSLFSLGATPDQSSAPTPLLWRNQSDPYLDWTVVVERVPSGVEDTYRVHKLVVGAGAGASLRLAKEFEQSPTMTEAHFALSDELADRIPDVLDWIYLPRGDAHKFDKGQFVSLMILADELDIPSLRDHLTQQYQQKVTVDDLTSIYGTWVQSKEEAERLVATAADRITGLITGKIVDVIQSGNDADMDRLVDGLATVADQDLIVSVMTSEALMDDGAAPLSNNSRSLVKSRSSSVTKRGWRSPIRIRFSESSLRMGRFVAKFIRTNGKSSSSVDTSSLAYTKGASEASVEVRDAAPTNASSAIANSNGTSSAAAQQSTLLDQLVQTWASRYQSFQNEMTSSLLQTTNGKGWEYDKAQAQIQASCQRQRELLENSLREALEGSHAAVVTAAAHPHVSQVLTQVFGEQLGSGLTFSPKKNCGGRPSSGAAICDDAEMTKEGGGGGGGALVRRSSALSFVAPFSRRSDRKKAPAAYAL